MSEDLLDALRHLFVGQILKHTDGRNLGIRVHRMDYDQAMDVLMLSVHYLELIEDAKYSDRDMLLIKFEDFISKLMYWNNQHTELDVTKAEWVPLSDMVRFG